MAEAGAASKPGPVDVLPIPKETVEKTVNPSNLPEYSGPTGVVEGTVYVTGDPAPPMMGKNFDKCPAAADFYAKTFREGKEVDGKRPLADAIVAVTGYGPGYYVAEKSPSKVLEISHCTYGARTIDLTFGQSLDVKNAGSAPMFAPDFENQVSPAIMVATLGGDPVHLYPKKPGRYRLIDRLGYSYLEADVFVLYQPLHTVSDITGHFRIEGVPVGKLKVNVDHPAIVGQHSEDIDVKDGVVTHVTLTVPNVKAATRPPSRDLKPILP
ncbi:MAG TPA: hypothetical protein VGH28_31860 [Polyangiaceae bacterium]